MLKHTLTFAVVSLLLAGCGGSESNEPETQGASPAADTVHAEACTTTLQTATSCLDYAGWKKATVAYCQSIGAVASSTQPQNACDAAGTRFSSALMTCCQ